MTSLSPQPMKGSGVHHGDAHELSPLEQLPPSLFCEIAKYLLVVDYDDDQMNKKRKTSTINRSAFRRPFLWPLSLVGVVVAWD